MKLTANAHALAPVLNRLAKVPHGANTIPVLSHVLIDAGADGLTLTATDMDKWMTETMDISATEPGTICVPVKELARTIGALGDGADVELELDGETLAIRSGRARWTLPVLQPGDFPPTPPLTGDGWAIPAVTLVDALKNTLPFTCANAAKYYLMGVHMFRTTDDELQFRAADGHRVAYVTLDAPDGLDLPDVGILLPQEAAGLLVAALAKAEGMVHVTATDARVRFTHGPLAITTRLLDATFPDTDRIVPTHDKTATAPIGHMAALARRALGVLDVKKSMIAKMTFAAGEIGIEAINREDGRTYQDLCEAETTDGLPDMGMNMQYLAQTLDGLGDDGAPVTLHIGDAQDPVKFTCDATPHMFRVVMPARL